MTGSVRVRACALAAALGGLASAAAGCGDRHDGGGEAQGPDAAAGAPGGGGGTAPTSGGGGSAGGRSGSGGAAGAGGAGGMCQPTTACSLPGCDVAGPLPGGISLTGVWIGPAGEVWAVGEAGFVGRRDSAISAWCWCAPSPPATLRAVWGASSSDVFAVGDAGTLLRFDGARWLRYPFRSSAALRAIHGTAADNVWAVGDFGNAFRFDGTDWRSDQADSKYELGAVWIDPAGVVHTGGRAPLPDPNPYMPTFNVEAAFLRHAPGAAGWEIEGSIPQRGGIAVLAMMGAAATDIWAGGVDFPSGAAEGSGGLFRFDGVTWTRVRPMPEVLSRNNITDVAVGTPDRNATWFVGTRAGLRFDGTTFMDVPQLSGAAAIDARGVEMYAVGTNGIVFRWTAAIGWQTDRAASPPAAVDVPSLP